MAVTDHRAGADTAGYDLFWVEEANWGAVPAGPPTLETMRVTSESLKLNTKLFQQRSNLILMN